MDDAKWCPANRAGEHDWYETRSGVYRCANCGHRQKPASKGKEPTLHDAEPPHRLARATDPETSKTAAYLNPGRRGTHRERLARAYLDSEPLTWDRAAMKAGVPDKSSPWRRITELVERGILEVCGIGKTLSNAEGQLYRLTLEGERVLR